MGGAFDPPHTAHQRLAQTAVDQLGLDELLVIPTGRGAHKQRALSSPLHRLRMCQLAFEGSECPRARVDDCELNRDGVSYSFDTLVQLRAQHPNADWYLVIGADQAQVFDTWYKWEAILEMATLAVAVREPQGKFDPLDLDKAAQITQETTPNDHCVEVQGYRWHNRALIERLQNSRERSHAEVAVTLNMPSMSVSATQIRNSIQEGVDVSHLLNPAVHAYILSHSLYIPKSITE